MSGKEEKPCEHRIKVYVTGGVWCSECGAFRRATSKASDRNIKLNDHCDQCPWHRTAYGAFWCCYEPPARRIGQTDLPPDWCPIRGKVVTIEGPDGFPFASIKRSESSFGR